MTTDDRERWNRLYREQAPAPLEAPSSFLRSLDDVLPRAGRALDVAGGTGRHALWLAERGLEVTLVDVSDEALARAASEAVRRGVALRCVQADLPSAPLPEGPWDVIVDTHYLERALFPAFARALSSSGVLVFAQPTARNLERHPKPSRRFLLDEGELPGLLERAGLCAVRSDEGWTDEGRHEARALARRVLSMTGD